ncbi:MAG: hypothetical protein JSR82_03070 [Verrucomicrobia bacterium]|nr:hypothetical protein [Verrucomicrobiota bacterium]
MIDARSGQKICSFLTLANSSETIDGLPEGTFRIIFAYGDAIEAGTDRFAAPSGFSAFKDTFTFSTTSRGQFVYTKTYSITLHAVAGGTAKTGSISAEEYNRY